MGCARTNEYLRYMVKRRGIPTLEVEYPKDEEKDAKISSSRSKNF
jgi:Uncharacterized protein conserved in archaea